MEFIGLCNKTSPGVDIINARIKNLTHFTIPPLYVSEYVVEVNRAAVQDADRGRPSAEVVGYLIVAIFQQTCMYEPAFRVNDPVLADPGT